MSTELFHFLIFKEKQNESGHKVNKYKIPLFHDSLMINAIILEVCFFCEGERVVIFYECLHHFSLAFEKLPDLIKGNSNDERFHTKISRV